MAKRNGNGGSKNNFSAKSSAGRTSVDTSGAIATSFRNSPVPRNTPATARPAAPRQITHEMISQRAYEIWQRGHGGSQDDHWHQAVRELNGK